MNIFKNCWADISTSECIFGAHLFHGSIAKIHIVSGLDVGLENIDFKLNKDKYGFIGNCLLIFNGVKKFDLAVSQYDIKGGENIWCEPIYFNYMVGNIKIGKNVDDIIKYCLGGGLHGFLAYVAIEIEAENMELHILD